MVFYMGFTIKVPELSRRNLTPKDFFQFLAILLSHEICHLQELYPSEAIDDIKGPPLVYRVSPVQGCLPIS